MKPGALAPWHGLSEGDRELTIDRLEASLAGRVPGVYPLGAPAQPLNSAVLVPMFEAAGELHVLLTRRSLHLRSHPGEVSFPGGRQDPGESLLETALREASEEVDLPPSCVKKIGELDRLQTVSSASSIYPYVGFIDALPRLQPNPQEVDHILEVPLSELMAPGVFREELWPLWGPELRPISFFEVEGDTIWGATATMLRQLICVGLGLA